MSRIKEVTVNYGVTRNSGIKYEFIRLDFAAKADIIEGENATDIMKDLHQYLKLKVDEAINEELDFLHGPKPKIRGG